MRPLSLEVIAITREDAVAAEEGGADRIELVADLAQGGLTPSFDLIADVLETVLIPVRVMLRRRADFEAGDQQEQRSLAAQARELARWPIEGVVAGFLRDGAIDSRAMKRLVPAQFRCTVHRAVELLTDWQQALLDFQQLGNVDRVLTSGAAGTQHESWETRKARLIAWQRAAGETLAIVAGGGLSAANLIDLAGTTSLSAFHTGRAVRQNHSLRGPVLANQVAALQESLKAARAAYSGRERIVF